jgi:hypothetical protein
MRSHDVLMQHRKAVELVELMAKKQPEALDHERIVMGPS